MPNWFVRLSNVRSNRFPEILRRRHESQTAAHRCKQAEAGRRRCDPRSRRLGDCAHTHDVGAAQQEHALHPAVRGNARELRPHAFEYRSRRQGFLVVEVKPVIGHVRGIDDGDRGGAGRENVLPGLVEELVAERHVIGVDVMHLRDHRYVGNPLGIAGCHYGGNEPLEAAADGIQCNPAHCRALPALGPGVWTKACSGKKVSVTRSCGSNPQ